MTGIYPYFNFLNRYFPVATPFGLVVAQVVKN